MYVAGGQEARSDVDRDVMYVAGGQDDVHGSTSAVGGRMPEAVTRSDVDRDVMYVAGGQDDVHGSTGAARGDPRRRIA